MRFGELHQSRGEAQCQFSKRLDEVHSGIVADYFAKLKRFSISGQFTTLHHAAMYSGRRF
jgi:hypothetical protein